MRIISVGTLKAFWEQPVHRDAEQPVRAWVRVVRGAAWANPPAVKRIFNSADILLDSRVVFDIDGNKYRLVAWVNYHYRVVYVRNSSAGSTARSHAIAGGDRRRASDSMLVSMR